MAPLAALARRAILDAAVRIVAERAQRDGLLTVEEIVGTGEGARAGEVGMHDLDRQHLGCGCSGQAADFHVLKSVVGKARLPIKGAALGRVEIDLGPERCGVVEMAVGPEPVSIAHAHRGACGQIAAQAHPAGDVLTVVRPPKRPVAIR